MKTTLVLGTERSGSTWVANVFDAHPAVELVMEPLADHANLVPGFPAREVPVDARDPVLALVLRAGVEAAARHKYALLYRRGLPSRLERVDAWVVGAMRRGARRLGRPAPEWARRHASLNLHASEVPAKLRPRKRRTADVRVLKELRLNFKLGILAAALPDARAIVTLRNPAAQIASITRLFSAGHLIELERSLAHPHALAASDSRFARVRSLAEADSHSGQTTDALIRWWLLNNQWLLEGLRRRSIAYRVVAHEELCESPLAVADALLEFAGLAPDPSVRAFALWSSTGRGDAASPLDVRRDSAAFHRRALASVSAELRQRVASALQSALEHGALAPDLASYLSKTCLPALEGAAEGQR